VKGAAGAEKICGGKGGSARWGTREKRKRCGGEKKTVPGSKKERLNRKEGKFRYVEKTPRENDRNELQAGHQKENIPAASAAILGGGWKSE